MKFTDLLLGFAIGDAFGAGIEFQDRNWIKENVDFTKFINVRAVIDKKLNSNLFSKNYQAWSYSDDTEMTIGLIKALISKEKFTPDLLIKYWTIEYNKGILENGFGRNGHGSMSWFFEGSKSIEEIRDFQRNRDYPGNAPPMRAMPLGFLPSNLINEYAIINADATHPHQKARAASIIVARATEFLIVKKGDAQKLIDCCAAHVEGIDQETSELLLKIDLLPPPAELSTSDFEIICGKQPIEAPRFLPGINGLPSDALLTGGAVLYILKHSKNAFEGLKNSIYLGGDVDTIASICCGVLSGLYGVQSLPAFMLENVEGKEYLEEIASKFQGYINKLLRVFKKVCQR
jgi:ADP-ribosylglycohydrolase